MNNRNSVVSRRGIVRLALIAAFVLTGLGLTSFGSNALAQDVSIAAFTPGQTAIVADGPLNLRSGPGLGYSVTGSLATGEYVELQSDPTYADGYSWYFVYVDSTGGTGYLAGEFLTIVSGGPFAIGDTVFVDTDVLNVRSGPGTGYAVIDSIAYGTNGLIIDGPATADGYIWYQLEYVGGTSNGWVASDFLSLGSTGGGFAIGDIVAVDSVNLNVRSGPGTGYAVIDTLYAGDQSVVLDGPVSADGYTWYQVSYSYGGYTGWVAGEFLYYVSGGGISIGTTVYVTTDVLNVRTGPGTGYAVQDTLYYGVEGYVLDGPSYADGYTWYQLEYYGGAVGWVAGEFLALL